MRSTHPVLFVIVHEGEWQGDVEWLALVGSGCPLPRLEGHHQVNPSGWPLGFEHVNEVSAKDFHQEGLKLQVHS